MLTVNRDLADPVAKTLSEHAFSLLRRDLLSGLLPPNEKLHLQWLSATYRIGLSPLREALVRLTADGLVVAEGQRGFRGAPVSVLDMSHVMSARAEIEELALRQCYAHADINWESAVVAAFHRLSRSVSIDIHTRKINEEWAVAHLDFHRSLVAACPNQWLLRFWQICYDQTDRYRRLAVSLGTKVRDDLAEHRAMMEAALLRDVERACQLSRDQITGTEAIVRKYFGSISKTNELGNTARPPKAPSILSAKEKKRRTNQQVPGKR